MPRTAALLAANTDCIAVCEHIHEEIHRTLRGKFGRETAEIRDALAAFWARALWVKTTGSISGVCRDPNDDAILECAVLANATLIVTGDHDLLELGRYGDVRIVTARQYVERAEAAAQ